MLDIFVSQSAKVGAPAELPSDFYLGPATVLNSHEFEAVSGNALAMIPTIIGSIAEGIMLTASDAEPAKLSLQFDCREHNQHNEMQVEIPIQVGGDE